MESFYGFVRDNEQVGVRNYLLVLSGTIYANEVVNRVAGTVPNAVGITHPLGRCQTRGDLRKTFNTLVGFGKNPNAGAVIVVEHYKEEGCTASQIAEEIAKTGKPVATVNIHDCGGTLEATTKTFRYALDFARKISTQQREKVAVDKLLLGLNCGTSDTTSGLAPNPALGKCSDRLIDLGGRSIIAETTEFIGGEDVLAERAVNQKVAQEIYRIVNNMEEEILAEGEDIRGSQPTGDNMAGGLSTLEEKSLGAIKKSGSQPIQGVLDWAQEPPSDSGLYIMDTPGHGGESITGIAAGGAQVLVFTTGGGHTISHPLMPTLKVTANEQSLELMRDTIDIDITDVFASGLSLNEAGERIYQEVLATCSGKLTKCEVLGEQTGMAIAREAPSV